MKKNEIIQVLAKQAYSYYHQVNQDVMQKNELGGWFNHQGIDALKKRIRNVQVEDLVLEISSMHIWNKSIKNILLK